MTFPDFDNDREQFVKFVQANKSVFDSLLFSGKYYLTRGLNTRHVNEGYRFMRNLNLTDDATLGALMYNLDDFNDEEHIDIHIIVDAFISWFGHDLSQKYIRKEFNIKQR